MQGFDEIAAQINIIRRGAETFHRIPQHGVIILGLFHDPGNYDFMALCQKLFPQFKNQLGLGEGGRVPDGQPFRHFLKIVQGAFPQFIDVNLLQNRGCFLLLPDCVSTIFLRSGSRLFPGGFFRRGQGLGEGFLRNISGGGRGVVEFFSHEKMLVKSLGLLAEQVRGAFIPDDEVGRSHFFHDRPLGRQNGFNHILPESIPDSQAGFLRSPGNSHHAHGILAIARRSFKKQGHVNDKPVHLRILTRRQHLRKTFLMQQGVNDPFQRSAAFRIPENKLPQKMPVSLSGGVYAGWAEDAGEGGFQRTAIQQSARLRITVKQAQARASRLHQQTDECRFPGGYSSGNNQGFHGGKGK